MIYFGRVFQIEQVWGIKENFRLFVLANGCTNVKVKLDDRRRVDDFGIKHLEGSQQVYELFCTLYIN